MAASSLNALSIDSGLIDSLLIRLNDSTIAPDPSWFESICKYVYEKIKNEDIFLHNFYQSSAYRKLLLELEFYSNLNIDSEIDSTAGTHAHHLQHMETGSDSNSGDLAFDDEIDFVSLDGMDPLTSFAAMGNNPQKISPKHQLHHSPAHQPTQSYEQPIEHHSKGDKYHNVSGGKSSESVNSALEAIPHTDASPNHSQSNLLDVISAGVSKHYRSHSDCTGLVQNISDINIEPINQSIDSHHLINPPIAVAVATLKMELDCAERLRTSSHSSSSDIDNVTLVCPQHRLSAKIINTAINCDGQFAVYAIHVTIIEDNQQKSWHVYRRYSRFLDLKKALVKRVC